MIDAHIKAILLPCVFHKFIPVENNKIPETVYANERFDFQGVTSDELTKAWTFEMPREEK